MSADNPNFKAILTRALDHPPGDGRDDYLRTACRGDDSLRRRIDHLLAAFDEASEVLDPDGPSAAATTCADPEATSDHIPGAAGPPPAVTIDGGDGDPWDPGKTVRYFGDYEIRKELGRGGMGVVYEARQVSLNRPVALKMVKAGLLAGDDELRRFRNEAEAVALLDHPGVVPVYEVGHHDGQHYFSMKLVTGGSLVPRMGRYKQDARAAARLMAEAAEAVAHAHARGILHRDLKPANILVDEDDHPQVTDFGLAKRLERDVELTQSGAILGTPAYMSPEQAGGQRGAVTIASDVYGLGTVLYALLTGRAPFVGDSVVETIDAVRNRPPEPPSRSNASVPPDLETICLKCLEKEPRRRYATAQALADDLRAWLDSRPISARRVGAAERAWLWCKRKPAIAALAAAVILAVVGGAAATMAVQARANAALRRKNNDLATALGREASANAALAAANRRVEQRYELAMDAIGTFHTGVSEDFLLKEPRFKDLRDRLLRSAADFYGKLGSLLGQEADPASRRALAQAEYEVARLTDRLGLREAALAAHRRVLAAREALASEPGAGSEAAADVGRSLAAVGQLHWNAGQADEAREAFRSAEARLAEALRAAPGDASVRSALGVAREQLGWLLAERGLTREALDVLGRARSDLEMPGGPGAGPSEIRVARARVAASLCQTYLILADFPRALGENRTALGIYKALAAADPKDVQFRGALATAYYNGSNVLQRLGDRAASERELRAALEVQEALVADYPSVTAFRHWAAWYRTCTGLVIHQSGDPAGAVRMIRAAQAELESLLDPRHLDTQVALVLATTDMHLARILGEMGDAAGSESGYRKALAVSRTASAADPGNREFRGMVGAVLMKVGLAERKAGRWAEAAASLREGASIRDQIPPALPFSRYDLACNHALLSGLSAQPGSGVSAAEGRLEADRAMHWLRAAIAAGFRDYAHMRTDADLDPLRPRPDFGLLMLDVAFPAEPFAATH